MYPLMHRLHVTLKIHSLNGLKGAQLTGKTFLPRMGSLMSLQMANIPAYLETTNLALKDYAGPMKLSHVPTKLKLVGKILMTDGTYYRHPGREGRGSFRLRSRGTAGRC